MVYLGRPAYLEANGEKKSKAGNKVGGLMYHIKVGSTTHNDGLFRPFLILSTIHGNSGANEL